MVALAVTGLTACDPPEPDDPDSGTPATQVDAGQSGGGDGGTDGGDTDPGTADAGDAGGVGTPDAGDAGGAGTPDAGDAGPGGSDGGAPDGGRCEPASAELCNGIDDDCDGEVDEGFALGTSCDGPDSDRCMEGKVVCGANGGTVCSDTTADSVELCNLSDDDCDGEVDEGFHVGESCDGKDSDLCAEGELVCNASGGVVCSDVTSNTVERCNGEDDDCDGKVDEDFDLRTDPAHCGRCDKSCGASETCSNGSCVPPSEQACGNGNDDDGDGYTDCVDPDCESRACGTGCICEGNARTESVCDDQLDNDGDGRLDCSDPDCDGPSCATLSSITLSPGDVQLVIQGSTRAVQAFTVTGTYSDGHTEDVTAQAAFSVDDTRLGLFSGATFTSGTSVGGTSNVRARVGALSVSTPITVKLEQRILDPISASLPPQPELRFDGAVDAARKPQLLHPNSGVMIPPNLGQMEIHFLPGADSNTLFELSFRNGITDVRVYLRCYVPSGFSLPTGVSRGCIYTLTEEVWRFVAESNRGGQPVELVLRGTGDLLTGPVGVSDPIALQISRSTVEGALYYFTTANNMAIVRQDFVGNDSTYATSVLRASNIEGSSVTCVGCHSVSRDGKRMVAGVNGQNDGRIALADLSTLTSTTRLPLAQGGTQLSTFESWNPEGSRFVGVYGDTNATRFNLMLFDGSTGALLQEIANTGTSANPASHPDWSADGKTIAFTSVGIKQTLQRFFKGSIQLVSEQPGGGWSEPMTVVPSQSGKNRYAPAIAPDSSFLVYNESSCPSGSGESHMNCNSESDPSARMWVARLHASAAPVELARANAPGVMDGSTVDLTNGYPRWYPNVTRGSVGSDRLMWVTFASSRMYGLRRPPGSIGENLKGVLLWMAAVDPDKLAAGEDPSFAAFPVPMQNLSASSHLPQWVSYRVSNGCSTVGEACGASEGSCCNGTQCVQRDSDPPLPCDVSGACVCLAIPQ
ncbi:PD40 domain-containing protein [Archangium violaceum]|uniref:PD40 domain-containing protein n=1 Tax=Archangium violaceum TaxID=83451 RepID=UPI00195063CA|nr:PD40 domain-containing protein [Archangium violaceum]QRN94767.1 PD40 domain-containing protein [Archangium violaceum]